MARSFAPSLRPVWVARGQEFAPRLQFWLLLAGYDLRDRSRADLLYVPYLVVFWLVWAFAMFAALSGAVAALFKALNASTPALAAVQLLFWALLLWLVVALYRATRRSPVVFSGADAALLCQTPVDRRVVVLIWFLTAWPGHVLPFAAGALALGFGLFEATHLVEVIDPVAVLGYSGFGLRALGLVLPLHFLLLALMWAAGVWRLHGGQVRRHLRWLPPLVALLLAPVLLSGWQQAPAPDWRRAALWPLLAAFGLSSWLPAFLAVAGLALLAVALLRYAARAFNLSRAAQETSQLHSERYLAWVGAREAAAQLKRVRRLGAESQGTRLPARAGLWALVWKDLVRSGRGWQAALWSWLGILGLSIGIIVAPDWGSRLVALVFWIQLVVNRTTAVLRDNLAHWWLWWQQPYPAWQLVGSALALPASLLVLLSLLAWGIGGQLPFVPDFSMAPLLPLLGIQVALVATWNLLGGLQPADLLAGQAPTVTVAGLFLALLLVSVPVAVAGAITRFTNAGWIGIVTGLLLSVLLSALLARLVADRTRRFA